MNLKIKCETPREQVLVLRKFNKLFPDVKWNGGDQLLFFIPYIDSNILQCFLLLHDDNMVTYNDSVRDAFKYPEITASDFLRDDWKPTPDNSELKAIFEGIAKKIDLLKELLDK